MGPRPDVPLLNRITPLDANALPADMRARVRAAEELMGFVANDVLIMARSPALLEAFAQLAGAVYAPGKIDAALKRLIGLVASSAAGCVYCMGHTAFASERHGVSAQQLDTVWEFESSEHFSVAEKAALRVAMHASQVPGGVDDAMFAELAAHFDEDAQLEIVAVIAMFGFLNRWNSTLETQLESVPAKTLQRVYRG